jgi:hypothetical protein
MRAATTHTLGLFRLSGLSAVVWTTSQAAVIAADAPVHRCEFRVGTDHSITTAEYEPVEGGGYLPARVQTNALGPKGSLKYERSITVSDAQFGVDIDPQTWSLAGLDLPISTPVPVPSDLAKPAPSEPRRLLFISANVVLIAVVLALLFLYRARFSRRESAANPIGRRT